MGSRSLLLFAPTLLAAQGMLVAPFAAEVRTVYDAGLPSDDVTSLAIDSSGSVWAATRAGLAQWRDGRWTSQRVEASRVAASGADTFFAAQSSLWQLASGAAPKRVAELPAQPLHIYAGTPLLLSTGDGLFRLENGRFVPENGSPREVRQAAVARDGRMAAAAASGLFLKRAAGEWERILPHSGKRSWAPNDVRGVAFDSMDRLWFASPEGVGRMDGTTWTLYTGADGLPYDDFTTAAAGENGVVWFGTHSGAIRFDGKNWEYRQGRRWLPDDDVRAIAVAPSGDAWIATAKGIARIERRVTTLAEKARFFESEIDRRHRRTAYGYVLEVRLDKPGDVSKWTQHDSDNDGLWTSMYGAGECFAAAVGNEEARRRAVAAFEALRFLGTVTQGGPHPAPRGFVARSILPADGPDPNRQDSPEHDRQMRETRDHLWKSITPRWPLSADAKWYWKSDTSSDELDGHYFFYGVYYDLVARSDEEKRAVREHVAAMTDHLVDHDFKLVDHDGKPTRWGIFDPKSLNHNLTFWGERGMNSLSMLAYLKVAGHITGDPKYERAYRKLIEEHAYEENVLIPKSNAGPGAGNQSDDEMIFMNYYGLLRYEKEPELRHKYLLAFYNHWKMEEPETNPLFNFLYAAIASGESHTNAFNTTDLTPGGPWLDDSVETLRRLPIDRVAWGFHNSHRTDIVPLPFTARESQAPSRGYRVNGKVVPIDERYVNHWNHDPWRLDQPGDGRMLGDGAAYLLPYYLGLYTRFIRE
jgi:Two component regulator propeller